jgi:hypothetical protein
MVGVRIVGSTGTEDDEQHRVDVIPRLVTPAIVFHVYQPEWADSKRTSNLQLSFRAPRLPLSLPFVRIL